ncbi:9039_t:CDS:2, partial [Cetraspora pellucida]
TFIEKYDINNTSIELRAEKKFLPENIITILKNENFWSNLFQLKEILLPFCFGLDKLQRDNAKLFEIIYYYSAWFGNTPNSILYKLNMYRKQLYSFNIATFNNFKDNVLNYWEFVASNSQFELPKLACHIFAVAVNTASVEQLFSSMETNKDNVETFLEDLDNGSEDDEIEDKNAMQQVIDKWIEMLEDEATENIEQTSNIIRTNNQSLDEILIKEHPCQDRNAKWLLENLFIAELELPKFINKNLS